MEKYVKQTWADRRGPESGTEIYRLTEDEATALFARCRVWVAEELPRLRQVEQFEGMEPEPTLLPRHELAEQMRAQPDSWGRPAVTYSCSSPDDRLEAWRSDCPVMPISGRSVVLRGRLLVD